MHHGHMKAAEITPASTVLLRLPNFRNWTG